MRANFCHKKTQNDWRRALFETGLSNSLNKAKKKVCEILVLIIIIIQKGKLSAHNPIRWWTVYLYSMKVYTAVKMQSSKPLIGEHEQQITHTWLDRAGLMFTFKGKAYLSPIETLAGFLKPSNFQYAAQLTTEDISNLPIHWPT